MADKNESVKVVVRIRPISSEEERNGNLIAAEAHSDRGLIVDKNPKTNDRLVSLNQILLKENC